MLLFWQARGKGDERYGEEGSGMLLSGDHARVRAWRESEARGRSLARGTKSL
ncbi:MAG: hypothetical protein ACRDSJ_06570 [Rubrobacteraceae bacterium]